MASTMVGTVHVATHQQKILMATLPKLINRAIRTITNYFTRVHKYHEQGGKLRQAQARRLVAARRTLRQSDFIVKGRHVRTVKNPYRLKEQPARILGTHIERHKVRKARNLRCRSQAM